MPRRVISEREARYLERTRPQAAAPMDEEMTFGGPAFEVEGLPGTASPAPAVEPDAEVVPQKDYASAVLQYVPLESVAAFTFLNGLFASGGFFPRWMQWGALGVLVIGTFLYAKRATAHPRLATPWVQVCFYTLAFVAWAMTVGGPFRDIKGFQPGWGTVLAGLVVFLGPLVPASLGRQDGGDAPDAGSASPS